SCSLCAMAGAAVAIQAVRASSPGKIWRMCDPKGDSSGFFRLIANAWHFAAAGATGAVLGFHRGVEIDPRDIGDRRQPGQHIGDLFRLLLLFTAAQGGGKLTYFFHQPHERAGDPPVAGPWRRKSWRSNAANGLGSMRPPYSYVLMVFL